MTKYTSTVALTLGLLLGQFLGQAPAMAQGTTPALNEADAQAIAAEAYVYFYPLVTMDLTRKQLTNVEPGTAALGGPPNTFNNLPEFPTADMRVVVRPNFD